MFYDRYVALCKENKVSPSKAAEDNGLSRTSVVKWKKGAVPSGATIQKLAGYFGVTSDYLIGNVNDPLFYLDNERILKEINSYESVFYDLFSELCANKGVTPSKACLDMGLSRSLAAKWKNTKATPSFDVVGKIADYFSVSADFLLRGSEAKEPSPPGNPRSISDEDIKFALFNGDEDITDEMYDEVKAYAEFVKQKYQKGK